MATSYRILRILAFLFVLLFTSTTAFADDAILRGRVVDPFGAAVAGAQVLVTARSEVVARADSDAAGAFEISGLAPNRYELHVVREGFRAVPMEVDLTDGDLPPVTLQLQVSAINEAIVVSAAEVDLPLSRTPATTTVIGREEIEAYQENTVGDALARVPGLSLARTGVEGAVTSLFSRGGESDFTAVAIDGVPVNIFGGGFDFGHLTSGGVERIEVVRGPQSALWSGAAIGGVINVITRPDARRAFAASAELATRGGDRLTAGAVVPIAEWRVSVGGERQTSNGLNGRTYAAGRIVNDDWRAEHVNAGVWRDGRSRVALTTRFDRSERGYPGAYGSDPGGTYFGIDGISRGNTRSALGGLSASRAFSRVRTSGDVHLFRMSSDYLDPFGPSTSTSRAIAARGQGDLLAGGPVGATAGAEWLQERATSSYITGPGSTPAPVRRRVGSIFAEVRYDAGPLFVAAGTRIEAIRRERLDADPNAFSPRPVLPEDTVTAVTPRISASWFLRPASDRGGWTRLRASAGLGIRPPDAFELAFSDNPALKPERTRSAEVGLEQALAGGRVIADVTAFSNRYDDLIVTVGRFLGNASQYQSDNISNARARGVETSVSVRTAGGFSGSAGYTFLDSEVLALDRVGVAPPPFTVGDPLIRRPRHQGWARASWRVRSADLFVTLGARGRTLDIDPSFGAFGGLYPAPGYAVMGAGGTWRARQHVQAFARVTNLLDRRYEDVLGFPAAPRTLHVGVRLDLR